MPQKRPAANGESCKAGFFVLPAGNETSSRARADIWLALWEVFL